MSSYEMSTTEKEVPSLEELLSALSTTARNTGQRDIELRNTLVSLLARESLDGVRRGEYMRLAILLGFKRRNHTKSRAVGDGDGERGFLRAILLELYDLVGEAEDNAVLAELVNVVLPLVPLYGSWRDLLVLGERSFPAEEVEATGDSEEVKSSVCLPALGRAVGQVFATQLRRDMDAVESKDGVNDEEEQVPSNACKYAPHEGRHTGNTTVKPGVERTNKKSKHSYANRIQKCLADEVATLVLAKEGGEKAMKNPCLRADYRKFLGKLKRVLTARGFVIEPLLCKRNLHAIDFNRANKGALAKNRKCLEKDPAIKAKWRKAMMANDNAVADIDSLQEAAANIIEEKNEISEHCDRVSSLRVLKCITGFRESRKEIQDSAEALLEQISSNTAVDDAARHELRESITVPVLPVVDSSACESEEEMVSLIIAAFVTARMQNLTSVVLDGETILLPVLRDSSAVVDRAEALAVREFTARCTTNFFESACVVASRVFDRDAEGVCEGVDITRISQMRRAPYLDRLRRNAEEALKSSPSHEEKESMPSDVMYLTTCDMSREVTDVDSYRQLVEEHLRVAGQSTLRSLNLCRVSESVNVQVETPLVLRQNISHKSPAEISLDLCLVMDLTASMGSWMTAAKDHLTGIVASLKKETKIGSIRVSYLGYRDWQDNGRLVTHDFVPIGRADATIIPLMQAQHPSGGNDMEEDVLIAFHAALTDLHWQSDLRLMLLVADAPAHGYGDYGDRFKDGRCPDQKPPHLSLPETMEKLAHDKGVDLLCCRLGGGTCNEKMERMFSGVYADGPGFGVLPIAHGAGKFKDALLSTLSTSMLQALAPVDVAGLQSFSGGTSSSLLRVINTSLRESISSVTSILRGDNVAEEDEVGLEGVKCTMEDEDKEEDEVEGGKMTAGSAKASRHNFERLMSELEADELQPVRLALGMSLRREMQQESALVLLAAGVTVQDLVDKNYPEEIIQVMKEEGVKKLDRL